jgi:hypothetical protein
MEKFKEKIRIRTIWMSVTAIFAAVINLFFVFNKTELPTVPDFVKGFQAGVITGLELILVFLIARNIASMKSEKKLKKLYIRETDERRIMILQKTGSIGIEICSIGLILAAIVAGYFSKLVFLTLLGAAAFTLNVRLFLKVYYLRKF